LIELNKIYNENCLSGMKKIDDQSIDLIFTSPPYADRRKNVYGGINENEYVDWFEPISEEIKRILKPSGSFFLNIKPHTINGERSLYVFDLVLFLQRNVGFLFIDEFCWTKNAFPGSHKGRFKNGFEPVYHFAINKPNKIKFNPIACGTPMKKESIARSYRKQTGKPKNGSGMTGMNTTNIRYLKLARPSNVINVHNVSNQYSDKQLHPATFPEGLVEFFIKSFSCDGDVILDPFVGIGTTAIVAKKINRDYIGFEIDQKYSEIAKNRLLNIQ